MNFCRNTFQKRVSVIKCNKRKTDRKEGPTMKLTNHGVFLCGGVPQSSASIRPEDGRRLTMAYRILQAHNQSGDEKKLRAQRVQLQLIVGSHLTQLLNVKGREACAAAHQDTFDEFCPPPSDIWHIDARRSDPAFLLPAP